MYSLQKMKALLVAVALLVIVSAILLQKIRYQSEITRKEQDRLLSLPIHVLSDMIRSQGGRAMVVSDSELIERKKIRLLEYFTYGTCLSGSRAILAIHGNGCTGSMFKQYDERAQKEGICLVAPTIPGWGLSLSDRAVNLIEFSTLIEQLMLNELKIEQFSVIGVSMGGPYAAGVAAKLQEHVNNVNLFAPFGKKAHDNEPFGSLNIVQKVAYNMLLSSYTRDFLTEWIILPSLKNDPEKTFENLYPYEYAGVKGTVHAKTLIGELNRSVNWTLVGMKESSAIILQEDWGFELEDIAQVKGHVIVTMAQNDTMVFENNPRYYAKKIVNGEKKSQLVILANRTHLVQC